jgi:hypothetical protein
MLFFLPSKRGFNFAKIRGFKVTDYNKWLTIKWVRKSLIPNGRFKLVLRRFRTAPDNQQFGSALDCQWVSPKFQPAAGGRPHRNAMGSRAQKKVPGRSCDLSGTLRTAAAYSSDWYVSTIGDGGLNFSVRNGKRWCPAAIAAAVYNLREMARIRTRKPQVRRT